jgi:imidazolonepropionase-like amidohydrolase
VSRTILAGGKVFDGTGAPVRDADVVVEAGRIVAVGPGLDGDEVVDMAGRCLLPGLFDCHTHVTLSDVDLLGHLQRPFSYRFFQTVGNLAATLAAGRWVMAHAQGADGIKAAVRAGIRSIEHGIYLDDEAIELMLERGTWLVPTLVAPRGVLAAAAAGVPLPDAAVRKAAEVTEAHTDSFRRAVAAGVKVAMGTDSGVTPHGRNLAELELMAKGGMAPATALHATTASAAALMGLEAELGTLEPGKRADVVAVDGDPFELATLPDRVAAVWQDGRLVAGRA